MLDGGALASLDVLGKRPREEDKHLLDGATLEVAERRQLRSRGQDDRPVLARRRRCRRVHARVDHLHARGRLPVVVPRNGTSQQCAWPGSAASPAGHGGKSRNLVNFRIDMRYSVLSHSYKSYFYLRTFVGRQPGPSVDVRKTQSCRFCLPRRGTKLESPQHTKSSSTGPRCKYSKLSLTYRRRWQ